MLVRIHLDSGSGVMVIPGCSREEASSPYAPVVRSFDGCARVVTAFGTERDIKKEIRSLHLVLENQWGGIRITVPVCCPFSFTPHSQDCRTGYTLGTNVLFEGELWSIPTAASARHTLGGSPKETVYKRRIQRPTWRMTIGTTRFTEAQPLRELRW